MLISRLATFSLLVISAGAACGQDFPLRTLRIVTSAVGGSGDLLSRFIAQEIAAPLGQAVIVENRASNIGPEVVTKAPPDGYTLLEGGSAVWLTPLLQDGTPWDALRDFAPVSLVERSPNVLVVHPSLPVKSVLELIALARARPGELNFSTSAPGGSSHLAGELFKLMTGVKIVWVPYKGSAAAAVALMVGEVQLAFSNAGAVMPLFKAGKLRALAITGTRPSLLVPDLPTVSESGLPGFEVESIDAIWMPARTPPAIVRRLNQEIVRVLNRPEVKARLLTMGIEAASSSSEELAALIRSETAKWGKLIREAGIRVN